MKSFWMSIWEDLKTITWRQSAVLAFAVFAIYGLQLTNPTTFYDFSSAKGDPLQVFLTYFFMHRIVIGAVAAFFHDFAPMWKFAFGLGFLFLSAHLFIVLLKRLGVSRKLAVLLAILWMATPFLVSITLYQHAMPTQTIAICADMLALISFEAMRRGDDVMGNARRVVFWSFVAIGSYEANASFLLTGLLGVCMLSPVKTWRQWLKDMAKVFALLAGAILLWCVVNYGPMFVVKLLGVNIPKSGGANTTINWLTGDHSFIDNVKAFAVGFLANWCYNAFFVIGIRFVLISLAFCVLLSVVYVFRRQYIRFMSTSFFSLSVFAFPLLQCSFSNLRAYYCLMPLIVFSALLAYRVCANRRLPKTILVVFLAFSALEMGHETSNLYYYSWKIKQHDTMHMGFVARDLWTRYGLRIEKPVAVIGGWKQYPTAWEDMRPCRFLPLLNHPFPMFSNMSGYNVPREFYMLAREKVGLVMTMADVGVKASLLNNPEIYREMPAYPEPGYIFERDDVIVVNLGKFDSQWERFEFDRFLSPNERLLKNVIGRNAFESSLISKTQWIRDLAAKYEWTVASDL